MALSLLNYFLWKIPVRSVKTKVESNNLLSLVAVLCSSWTWNRSESLIYLTLVFYFDIRFNALLFPGGSGAICKDNITNFYSSSSRPRKGFSSLTVEFVCVLRFRFHDTLLVLPL